jgi:hypothetical protein
MEDSGKRRRCIRRDSSNPDGMSGDMDVLEIDVG